jgi:hypothetical protein
MTKWGRIAERIYSRIGLVAAPAVWLRRCDARKAPGDRFSELRGDAL